MTKIETLVEAIESGESMKGHGPKCLNGDYSSLVLAVDLRDISDAEKIDGGDCSIVKSVSVEDLDEASGVMSNCD